MWAHASARTTYADVLELFRTHQIEPEIVDEAGPIQTILALVASGAGIALLPTSFINLGRRGVRFVPLHGPLPYRPLSVVWRTANQSPSVRCFLDVTMAAAPDYLADLRRDFPQLASPSRR